MPQLHRSGCMARQIGSAIAHERAADALNSLKRMVRGLVRAACQPKRVMSNNKDQQFTERLSAAASARRAMLEKFQARRAVDDPAARERRADQDALLLLVRFGRSRGSVIGDEPGTPLRIRTLLKKLYPAAKTDADRCCWARLPSPTASAARTALGAPPCAAR